MSLRVSVLDNVHGKYVFGWRVQVLARELAQQIPQGSRVLDVGCGDGTIAHLLMQARPDLTI
jgi:methylase of polypeptide subunit release factors